MSGGRIRVIGRAGAGRVRGPVLVLSIALIVGVVPEAAGALAAPRPAAGSRAARHVVRADRPLTAGFTAGDVVVYRVGDGSTGLGSAAAPVFLDDYGTSGGATPVSSVALPVATSGSSKSLVASGSSNSEGLLTLSADGRYLIATGYDAATGTAKVGSTAAATVPRTVARVAANGAVDTTTALTDFADGNNARGATSSDGTKIWVSGADSASGVRYTTLGSSTSTPLLAAPVNNARAVTIFDGQLYLSADPTKDGPGNANGNLTIATVGTGEPTTGGLTPVDLPFSPALPATNEPYQFAFLTLGTGTMPDTLYTADNQTGKGTTGLVEKYSLVGGSWVARGTVGVPNVAGVVANDAAGVVTIYATSSGTSGTSGALYKITDSSGADGTLSGTASQIATAPANEAFRGVAFAPGTVIGSGGPPPPVLPTITPSDTVLAASLGDPTNQPLGITVADTNFPSGPFTVTATSGNPTVAPQAGIGVTGTGTTRVLTLTPAAVGDATITLTVKAPDGQTASTTITYGVSANDGDASDRYYAGAGNGSGEVDVGGGYMIVVDDESNVLRLYQEGTSGLPVRTFDFTGMLPVGVTEADFEAATRAGNTLYVIGSMSNSDPAGKPEPARDIIFAATISGSGASTTLSYIGSYTHIREDVTAWDQANGNPLGLAASGASGVGSKQADGLNLEGMEFASGSTTTAYLAFRAPLEPTTNRTSALLVPVTNFSSLATSGNPGMAAATFGTAIEMNVGGLGIRDIRKNADNQYLIIGGTPDGSNSSFALYAWDGNPADPPILTNTPLPGIEDGAWEGIVAVPDPLVSGSKAELEEDNGDTVWYADGLSSKTTLAPDLQKDLGRTFTIVLPANAASSPALAPEGVITNGAGAPYGPVALTATGACTAGVPCSWSASPVLPPGLTLTASDNGQDATIAGTPSAVATAISTVTVAQAGTPQASVGLTISDVENLTAGVGAFPTGMVADTVDSRVYVAASQFNQVDSIDASANPIVSTPAALAPLNGLLSFPVGLAFDPSSRTLFVSDFASTSAAQLVAPAGAQTAKADPLTGCSQQQGIAEDSGGGDAWVGCAGGGSSGRVAVMTTTGGFLRSFTLAAGVSSPSGIAPTGTAGHVAVADAASGRLYTVNATTPLASVALPSGSAPANVAHATVGGSGYDYVADPGAGEFSVVDETNDLAPALRANVALPARANPAQPYGIATNGSSVLVVSDANNASAYVYTLSATAPYATLLYTLALPANAVPDGVADMTVAGTNLAFVGNESGNSVTVIDPPLPTPRAKPPKPIRLGVIGRLIARLLPHSPRTGVRQGHALYPGLK